MTHGHVQRYTSGRHLLKALTDNPELPAFIPTLPASGLKTLIDEIGLHDAGALIEVATPTQLNCIIDDDVWKPSAPGAPDRFDPAEFREWIDVLLEVGDEFAVGRLQAMDEDLLVMALMEYLQIVDLDKRMLDGSTYVKESYVMMDTAVDNKELYGPFEVSPRHEDEWGTIQPLLAALHVVDPDFLQALLTRCCLPESLLRFRDNLAAERDAAGAHRERREQQGFVSPEAAGGFLRKARDEDPAVLIAASEYDLDTQDYFKRALKAALDEATSAGGTRRLRLGYESATDPESTEGALDPQYVPDPERLDELEALVAQVELGTLSAPVQKLSGPGSAGRTMNSLQVALNGLAEVQPDGLTQRMNEAAYLSNLLMTGTRVGTSTLTHKESVAAVMATCNLGYELAPEFDLTVKPGLVGLFRVGWHFVQRVPPLVIQKLRMALADENVQASFGQRAWMVSDVLKAVASDELDADLDAARFAQLHEVLHMLSLVAEEHTVAHIKQLVDHLPTTVASPDDVHIRQQRRFIEHESDFAEIQHFLENLPDQLRG